VLILVCAAIRRHYHHVRRVLTSLDETLLNLPLSEPKTQPELAPDGPTAIVLVENYSGLGVHTLLSVMRLFPRHFKNIVFVSAGLVDSAQFKGVDELGALENKVHHDLEQFVALAGRMGMYAEYRYVLGTDLVQELETLCTDLVREFRRPVVFAGQLVFQRENLFTRTLHHETAFAIQRRLQFAGIQVIVLPIRVWEHRRRAATPARVRAAARWGHRPRSPWRSWHRAVRRAEAYAVAAMREYLRAGAAVLACSGIAALMQRYFEPTNLVMVYLLGVMWVAITAGRGPAAIAAVLSVAAFDYLFVPPLYTFRDRGHPVFRHARGHARRRARDRHARVAATRASSTRRAPTSVAPTRSPG
jgi:hypothetical protein